MTAPAYPNTTSELLAFDECDGLERRSSDVRYTARDRIGYSHEMVARLLSDGDDGPAVDVSVAYALEAGSLDVTVDANGNTTAVIDMAMLPEVKRVIGLYRRFLTAAALLPPRAEPQPVPETVAKARVGTADKARVDQLMSDLNGYANTTGATNLSAVQRVQALGNFTVADVAAAINVPTKDVFDWVTGAASPPLNNQGTAYLRALSFLAAGPAPKFKDSKGARAGNGTY